MGQGTGTNDSLVLSYLGLRKAVGIIGILLPFVLAFGKIVFEVPGLQSSISAYYYTGMRNVFVGSLCAIAVFLLSYRYDRTDDIAGDIACIFGVGVALCPTAPDMDPSIRDRIFGALHLLFATCFFLTLAYFALCLFTKTNTPRPTTRKLWRNRIYRVCGYSILACLVLIAVVKLAFSDSPINRLDPVFWLESIAIEAFGVSWLIKGEAILKDVEA